MKWLIIPALLLTLGAAAPMPADITKDSAGKEIVLALNQTANLILTKSGGTGYQWELDKVDEKILEIGEKSTRVPDNPPMAGGPVQITWPLTAVGKGKATIKARLVRPWMKDKPAKELEFIIVVK